MIETTFELDAPFPLSDYETERGKPMPDRNHAIIQGRIMSRIDRAYGDAFTLLPEIHLDLPKRDRVPDLAIYEPLVFDPDFNEIRMSKPPLCAIEILSARQDIHELMVKRSEYFVAGVQSYWLVLPEMRTIYIFYSLHDRSIFSYEDRLVDKKLNIELDLSDIFR